MKVTLYTALCVDWMRDESQVKDVKGCALGIVFGIIAKETENIIVIAQEYFFYLDGNYRDTLSIPKVCIIKEWRKTLEIPDPFTEHQKKKWSGADV